jgi:transposase
MVVPVRGLVATWLVDFRKGMDGLAALAGVPEGRSILGHCSCSGRSERTEPSWFGGMARVSVSLRNGWQGGFRWRRIEDGTVRLTAAQLVALIEGI